MSRNPDKEIALFCEEMQHYPAMKQCQTAVHATSKFYEGFEALHNGVDIEADAGVGDLHALVDELEQLAGEFAPAEQKENFKAAASAFSDSVVPSDLRHPAAPFARAELRVRKHEILCMEANVERGPHWAEILRQRNAELRKSIKSWGKILGASAPPSLN